MIPFYPRGNEDCWSGRTCSSGSMQGDQLLSTFITLPPSSLDHPYLQIMASPHSVPTPNSLNSCTHAWMHVCTQQSPNDCLDGVRLYSLCCTPETIDCNNWHCKLSILPLKKKKQTLFCRREFSKAPKMLHQRPTS